MKNFYTLLVIALIGFVGNAQIVNIPDANFKAKLLAASSTTFIAFDINYTRIKIDTNNDSNISVAEAQFVYRLTVNSSNISNLSGINSFTNLIALNCDYNQLTTLDVSGITGLQELNCDYNPGLNNLNITNCNALTKLRCNHDLLASLNVSNRTNLSILECSSNQIANLNITNCPSLSYLQCDSNQLTSLDVTNKVNLTTLGCGSNQLTTLDLTGMTSLLDLACILNDLTVLNVNNLTTLTSLSCGGNQLTALDVSNLLNLDTLNCHSNLLQSLDVSNLTHLSTLICKNNNISYLYLKNGYDYTLSTNELMYSYCIDQNPLMYICADANKIQSLQDYFGNSSATTISTYCSFHPGGTYYTIQGNSRVDIDANGCDVLDSAFPNLKLIINNGSDSIQYIANSSGQYSVPISIGTQLVTPLFENPNYFNVSPQNFNVTFPAGPSPFNQDFCFTPTGIYNDLEISILPLITARPGFNATYKLIYKNKGNTTQNGTVTLAFDDSKIDFVSATPNVTTQVTNSLSWSFSNLLPFETREILLTLNVNAPTETPAVNAGDVLSYTATIMGANDETPIDNTSTLSQIVFNSYDPNDKTCIEGTTITPGMVGQYVHYVVRFENDGTANAQNIVVKDIIDTSKFDISTLVPLSGSASYVTRITNTNQVEFVFQNINLPYAAGTNTGYVAFKIKTKPTLVVGSTFSNSANIYFDYNAPIVTNTYTTTITALATQDFDFGTYFSVYPNPVKHVLNLETKALINVKSINIYNLLGQMVIAIPNAESVSTIDVSDLKTGTYFIKVNTDNGTANAKFIKE